MTVLEIARLLEQHKAATGRKAGYVCCDYGCYSSGDLTPAEFAKHQAEVLGEGTQQTLPQYKWLYRSAVEREGLSDSWSFGVFRDGEETFTAVCATRQDAERVTEALLRLAASSVVATPEVERLRLFVEGVVQVCAWGRDAGVPIGDGGSVQDWGEKLGILVPIPHPQPCAIEYCECDGAPELLQFTWKVDSSDTPKGSHEAEPSGERCESRHYLTGWMCQREKGHDGIHVCDAGPNGQCWQTTSGSIVRAWVDRGDYACNQREATVDELAEFSRHFQTEQTPKGEGR